MGRRLESWSVVTGLSFLLLVGLLLVPLGGLCWASVVAEGGGLTLRHYAEFLGRPYYSRTIGHSFLVAGLVTLASLALAVPLAWAVAPADPPLASLLVLGGPLAIDASLEEAAAGLGAPRWRVFRTVTLPVTLPSVLGGALLVFLTAFADFGAPMIIGEGYQVLPTIVYSLFVNEMGGNPAMASTGATLLVLGTTAILLVQYWAVGRKRYA